MEIKISNFYFKIFTYIFRILIGTVGNKTDILYPVISKSKVYEIDPPLEIDDSEDEDDSDDDELDNEEIVKDLISKKLPALVCALPPNSRDKMLIAMTNTLKCLDMYTE